MDQIDPKYLDEPALGPVGATSERTGPATAASVLRVLRGLHRGAELAIGERDGLLVGSDEDCDVVLRDDGVAPHHLSIALGAPTVLRALADGVSVFGRALPTGDSVELAAYVPVSIGSATLALGEPDSPDWERVSAQPAGTTAAERTTAPAGNSAPAAGADASRAARPAVAARFNFESLPLPVLVAAATVLMLFVVGGVAAAWLAFSSDQATPPAARADGVIRTASAAGPQPGRHLADVVKSLDLPEVRIEQDAGGAETLVGTVPDDASLAKLEARLAAAGLRSESRVASAGRLVQDVREIFRVNGLNVDARYERDGVVAVAGLAGEEKRMAGVVSHALQDVHGLTSVRVDPAPAAAKPDVARDPEPPAPELTPEQSTAKRIASVVDGSPAYVVTADGSRYFIGALLPQGYRITAIEGGAVTVQTEKGEKLTMNF